MLISLCIPIHNRAYDLKRVMPALLDTAAASPPTEIAVVDYNSPDDLAQYMQAVFKMPKGDGVSMVYRKYTGRDYYHMAHARNLSVVASHGDYISIMSADIVPAQAFVPTIRQMIMETNCDWIYGKMSALITLRREEFVAAGGYDERFEFYGPEDRDLNDRLRRRGLKASWLPGGLLFTEHTPEAEKVRNYRLPLTKREMSDQMWAVYQENCANEVLVANLMGWGAWE